MASSPSWYARNRARSFPLRGDATAVANNGDMLPETVIADLSLRFTGDLTDVAYLRSVEITSRTVSLTIAVGGTTIATASAAIRDIGRWPSVPLKTKAKDAEGYVVFGDANSLGSWSFSSSAQSGLSWRAASPQSVAKSDPRLSRFGFTKLSGPNVNLLGTSDISVVNETLLLDGVEREAVVIKLSDDAENDPLKDYVGSCGKRPETETCGEPDPILALSGVQPDCCGRIFLEFRGCVDLHQLAGTCGVVIDCNTAAGDLCPAKELTLPTTDGELPEESGGETTTTEAPEDEECLEEEEPNESTQQF